MIEYRRELSSDLNKGFGNSRPQSKKQERRDTKSPYLVNHNPLSKSNKKKKSTNLKTPSSKSNSISKDEFELRDRFKEIKEESDEQESTNREISTNRERIQNSGRKIENQPSVLKDVDIFINTT